MVGPYRYTVPAFVPTMDVDVISLRKPFESLKGAQPWTRYGLELVFDHRQHIKLRHAAGNVEIDINVDTRFARLLDGPTVETIDGEPIAFCSAYRLAFAKLRTQRLDWPRDPIKRVQDRRDLMVLLNAHSTIAERLLQDEGVTEEMAQILRELMETLAQPASDELPPGDDALRS